jgi:hypothetical protein
MVSDANIRKPWGPIMTIIKRIAIAAFGLALAVPAAASADTYTLKTFTGGVFGGNANVQSPFNLAGITQGMTFTGTFLQDDSLVPGPASGFVNIFSDNYPDIGVIPAATIFTLGLGTLGLTAANDTQPFTGAGVQYNNGHFNGFAYTGDFAFQGSNYELTISGGTFGVLKLDSQGNPIFGTNYVNGYINIGDRAVAGGTPYSPPVPTQPGVPEPASWALMILGFGAAGAVLRRRRAIFA